MEKRKIWTLLQEEHKFICPLCSSRKTMFFHRDRSREYFHCMNCHLIFVLPCYFISSNQEKVQYDYHNNSPKDEGYRNFLSKIIIPLKRYIIPKMRGLDFGSGPGPTLHGMLKEEGFLMKIWDPFYANHPKALCEEYDFVTATEVVEHFNNPKKSWKLLTSLVKKQGYLAIMTLLYDGLSKDFGKWWYKNDATHVAFYSLQTLQWIAKYFHLHLSYYDARVAIFKKR